MTKKQEAKKRIEKLKKVINYHRYLYHVLDKQEISDGALDSLKRELYQLEQKFPNLITSDSPTQRVAGEPLKGFKKVKHKFPMLSMEDVFSEKELLDWQNYLERLESNTRFEYFCELKIDGFAVALIYENGIFICGATRGNGKIGEDVTQNLKTIESIPLKLEIQPKKFSLPKIKNKLEKLIKKGKIEIRGEVYMERKDFEEINRKREKQGLEPYANPRNIAAGSIRQLDSKIVAFRPLKFLAYSVITDVGQKTHSQEHLALHLLGFKADKGKECGNLEEAVQFWHWTGKKRKNLPFQIDGIVVNINNNSLFKKLGVAGKSPRGSRAFKFSPKQAVTIIEDIKIQVGRTGAVTPIAVLKPVEVEGITITRATLHNKGEIKKLGVKIGDTVIIQRAGDVIPAVDKVIKKLRTGQERYFRFPRHCPACGTKLVKQEKEAIWRCPNLNCFARKRNSLYYFASKKAFNIEGLGPKIVKRLMDKGLISSVPDIFGLRKEYLIPLEGFEERAAENLIKSIQKSKKISLSAFIYSLGIRHIGEETAINLARYFGGIDKLKNVSKEELEKIPDIGPEASETIYRWFQKKRNRKLIEKLSKAGVKILAPEKIGRRLENKTFVLTGSLETITRPEAEKKIRLLGGKPLKSVSIQTDFLVIGKNPGSKLEKAKKFGVKIINEKEFLKLLK